MLGIVAFGRILEDTTAPVVQLTNLFPLVIVVVYFSSMNCTKQCIVQRSISVCTACRCPIIF